MPTLDVYSLTFLSGFHIGRHGVGQERVLAHVPADTLFAALTAVMARWHGDATEAWAKRFASDPPFRLTSAYPYAGEVLFYPRPPLLPPGMDLKAWGKIRFLSTGILKKLLAGKLAEALYLKTQEEEPADSLTLQNGALWLLRDEIPFLPEGMRTKVDKKGRRNLGAKAIQRQKAWLQVRAPRVTVDRLSSTSEIFHTGRIQPSPGCGLWFGVEWQDASQKAELEDLLRLLGETGLGGERSAGYGAFRYVKLDQPVHWPDPQPGGQQMLLSRLYPRDEDESQALTEQGAAYELVHLAGRVQTPGVADQRRRGVRLVAEGSIVGSRAHGGLVDVVPTVGEFPHAVYRYGLALGIGMEAAHE